MSNKKEKVEVLETKELDSKKYKLTNNQFKNKPQPQARQRRATVYTR